MRRAAMLVLFALLAAALVFAQNPANSNAPAGNRQNVGTESTNSNGTSQNQESANRQNPVWHSTAGQAPGESTQTDVAAAASQNSPHAAPGATTSQENSMPSNGSAQGQVAAGTQIRATLDTPLSTKISKPGDRFTATVAQSVRGNNGNDIIPAGARVEGEVSEAEQGKALAALRGRDTLNLRFRDVVLPNGQSLPIAATLVSVHSTNGKDSRKAGQEGQVESGTRGRDVAKDVGVGAGIGAVAGPLFGSPLKGLAIGALAGGGFVLATNGKVVNLPAETGMVIKLDQPLNASGSISSRLQP